MHTVFYYGAKIILKQTMTDILLIFFGFYQLCTPKKNKNVYQEHLKERKELQKFEFYSNASCG